MTLSVKGLFVTAKMTFSINVTQHNNTIYKVPLCRVSRLILCYAGSHYAECRYAECRGALILPAARG
jgi:hypothetical protein